MEMNQRNFETDKRRVDKFEPQIKRICGEVFIKTAPKKVDCKEATDLLVLDLNPIRIACRVRYYEDLFKYFNEFTMRVSRPSGVKTELEKILNGWCGYNFYGFADKSDTYIKQWFIGDLSVFRDEYSALKLSGKIEKRTNSDETKFCAFKIKDLSEKFIYANGYRKYIMIEKSLDDPINNVINIYR